MYKILLALAVVLFVQLCRGADSDLPIEFEDAESFEAAESEVHIEKNADLHPVVALGEELLRKEDMQGAYQLYTEAFEETPEDLRAAPENMQVLVQYARMIYQTRNCKVGSKGREIIEQYRDKHPLISYYHYRCMAEDGVTSKSTLFESIDDVIRATKRMLPGALWQKSFFSKDTRTAHNVYKMMFDLPAYTADDCESKAFAYMRSQQYKRAYAWLKKGLELDPLRVEMLANFCAVHVYEDLLKDALTVCEKAHKQSHVEGLTNYVNGLSSIIEKVKVVLADQAKEVPVETSQGSEL